MMKQKPLRQFKLAKVSWPNGILKDAVVTEITVMAHTITEARKIAKRKSQ